MTTWRYQPVFTVHEGEKSFSVAQVYLDKDGLLSSWSKSKAAMPAGMSRAELKDDLIKMLIDVATYQPVAFADLKVGMRFQRSLDDAERAATLKLLGMTVLAGRKSRKR